MADLIDLRGLSLQRDGPDGPFTVLQDLDLQLAAGQRLALLGGNGSGKSSLLRYLATPGVLPGLRAGLVFQDPEEQLVAATVAEELRLGHPDLDVAPLLGQFGLTGRDHDDPHLLSAGQKQRLQLATVLAGRPDLLLLDEPTSLQDAHQAAWLRERLAAWPTAMIWATQRPEEVALCERTLVLAAGRAVADGPTADVLARPAASVLLERRYGPDPGRAAQPAADRKARTPVAELKDVACRFLDGGGFNGVDLVLRPGDRLGLTGPNGCGKSTLLAILAGLRRPDRGRVLLQGRQLYGRKQRDLDHGLVALAPQFPEYLFCRGDVGAEIRLDPRLRCTGPQALLSRLDLPAELAARHPHDLSGGQKRRLALGLALAGGRPLILLDEPTAALDASGRATVVELIRAIAPEVALVVASHDDGFLQACGCDVLRLEPGGLVPAAGNPVG